jgi:thioredoxin reductase
MDMYAGDETFDAAIIGGGPAGVSCAVWMARLGLRPVLLEAGRAIGGLCRSHDFADHWNASLPGATGPQVAENLATSLAQAGVATYLACPVASVAESSGGFDIHARGLCKPLRARHLVLASGVRARPITASGAASTADPSGAEVQAGADPARPFPGVLVGPGSHVAAESFEGKRVVVLGGGDNAFENALYAQAHGALSVRVHARNVRAQHQFVSRFPAQDVVVGKYEADPRSRRVDGVAYDLMLVFYGWEPCIDYIGALELRRSESGFVTTDIATAQTSVPGVYAIGEVAQRLHPCVVTALSDGVTAAKAIQARMEARQA